MSKLIGIYGSPYAGKTLVSCAASAEFAMQGKEVVLIFANNLVPTIPTLFPKLTSNVGAPINEIHSIGKIAKTVSLSENDILGEMVSLPNFKHIGMLGYAYGENENSYPKLYAEDVSAILAALQPLCDYVIVDCTSDFTHNEISMKSLEIADKIVCVSGCGYSDMAYFTSQLRRTEHFSVKQDDQIMVLNKISPYDAIKDITRFYKKVNVQLPYLPKIEEIRFMGSTLTEKFPAKFDAGIKKLCEELK